MMNKRNHPQWAPRPGPRWQRLVKQALLSLLGGSVLFVFSLLAVDLWIGFQARGKIVSDETLLIPTRYGVVLGTSKYHSDGINPFYEARISAAANLYHQGIVQILVASGDHSTPYYNEPRMMFDDLVAQEVPEEAIVQDGGGIRTLYSMRRLRSEYEMNEVIIISQRFHVERALYQAEASGIQAQGFAAHDAPFEWHARVRFREIFARVSAVLDLHILSTNETQSAPP
ncbi:MAG: ElyC/SanA/YdcF family protein [Natronospirillum sp.]